jgi:DmsE family decaheme c-type cytochrome
MKKNHSLYHALLLVAVSMFNPAVGEEQSPAAATPAADEARPVLLSEYTKKGADTCLKCHDESREYPVFDILKTKHGQVSDERSPFGGLQCEACHGPGVSGVAAMEEALERGGHVGKVRPGQERPPILNFGSKSDEPVELQNKMCLNCHQDADHIGWQGSVHEGGDLACANCHRIHVAEDPVLNKGTQPEVCFNCHLKERAEFLKPSNHPVRFGLMACSDCHTVHEAVHEAISESLLKKPTLNQMCYTCHAEKRGPLLWEHAPVTEDCSLCHTPHGSIHPTLLSKRAPLLCQQCHSQSGHPSVAHTASGLSTGVSSGFLLADSCLNCHTQVHGSNHPSGVKLMR